jgi:cell division protein FtsI (penicillin-binding protein 3)
MAAAASGSNNAKFRVYVLGGFLLLWAMAISARLVALQVVRYGEFTQRAARQQQRTQERPARRGIIYDRNGQELAMSVPVDSIFAVPSEIPDQASAAALLSKITGNDPEDLLSRFKANKNYAWVARRIDSELADRIRSVNLRGIYFTKEPRRFYPKRDLAAQVLGYVGSDDEGLAGVELEFEDTLHGVPGRVMILQDARRRQLSHVEREPVPGENVVLTLDENIQFIVERELDRAMAETGAVGGTVVVQNPKTGEILALANRPTYNPNVSREITPAALKNHAVSDIYEPGSVFKIVTLSAALEEKVARPDEMIDCAPGYIIVGGVKIRDHKPLGMLTVANVLAESSEVGAIKIGMRLGNERFYQYIQGFGFGKTTGVELPGETRGLAKPVSRWSKVSIGAMSTGQEIGVTPMQIVSMVSSIANDGMYTPPRIVAGTTEPTRGYQQVDFHPAEQHRVVSTTTAGEMKKMMQGVVLTGTGRKAVLNGYTSAGKTGTAQKIDPRTHAYSKTDYIGSFVGFAPVNTPAVTVAVILDSAKGLHQGGQICAPVFSRITQQVLEYQHVPHDAEIRNDPRQMLLAKVRDEDLQEDSPDHLGETLEAPAETVAASTTSAPPRTYAVAGPRVVSASFPTPAAQSRAARNDDPAPVAPLQVPERAAPEHPVGTVVLDVAAGQTVPSFVGKSLRDSIQLAQRSGFELHVVGNGIAREQSPGAGTRLPAGSRIAVRFSR